jgi:hypothetical protein
LSAVAAADTTISVKTADNASVDCVEAFAKALPMYVPASALGGNSRTIMPIAIVHLVTFRRSLSVSGEGGSDEAEVGL